MKKILSIFLSSVMIATCVLSLPLATQAKVNVDWTSTEVFNSSEREDVWLDLADIVGTALTATATSGTNKYNGTTNFLSKPILGSDEATDTTVTDFEWSFTEVGENTGWRRPDTLNVYFFHVGEESNCEAVFNYNYYDGKTVGFKDIKDCFAIAYAYNATEDGLAGWAFTVLQPTYDTDGTYLGLRPIKYTESDGVITPDASSYLAVYEGSRTGTADADTNKKIVDNYFQQKFTKDIKIALKGNQLTLEYLCTGTSTTLSGAKTFTLSSDALAKAPSGDFAISHNRDWSTDSNEDTVLEKDQSVHVCTYSNMIINEFTCATNEEYATTGLLFDSSDEDHWLTSSNANAITYKSDKEYYEFAKSAVTTEILTENGLPTEMVAGVKNFVWEFDLVVTNANSLKVAFLFHADEKTKASAGYVNGNINNLRNALGITFMGNTTGDTWRGVQKSINFCHADSDDEFLPSVRVNDTASETYKLLSGTQLAFDWANDTTYKVRIAYVDGDIQLVMYNPDNKAATYTTAYYEYTTAQQACAAAGGFAIVNHGASTVGVNNMKIYTGDNACQYAIDSEYENYKTEYTFDSDEGLVNTNTAENSTFELDSEKSALKMSSTDNAAVRMDNFDGGNDNLGDFIVKYDWQQNSNYTNDFVYFRKNDNNNYALNIKKTGTSATVTSPGHTISIIKTVDGDSTTLGSITVAKNVIANKKDYSIMLKAVGNTFEVYLAPKGTLYDMPVLVVTDSSENAFSTGSLGYTHITDDAYIYDMTIYDITAYNFGAVINNTELNKANVVSLLPSYNALNEVQVTKINTNTEFDEAVANIKEMSYNVNQDENNTVDICDLVRAYHGLTNVEIDADIDLDGENTAEDLVLIRKRLLGFS